MANWQDYHGNARTLFKKWQEMYEAGAKEVKFSGVDEGAAFAKLEQDVNDNVNKYIAEHKKCANFFVIFAAISVCALILWTQIDFFGWVLLVCGIVTYYYYVGRNDSAEVIKAADDFDKKYFAGGICYRRTHKQ